MQITLGTRYITRNGLTVIIEWKERDPRDRYPFGGTIQNGEQQGEKDWWREDGRFFEEGDHAMDLVREA